LTIKVRSWLASLLTTKKGGLQHPYYCPLRFSHFERGKAWPFA
jgi:hypothetical protein